MPGRQLTLAALAALLMLGAAPSWGQVTNAPSQGEEKTEEVGKLGLETYVQAAAIGNMFEIESAKLVAERSQEPGIRSFAMTLIADHTGLQTQLTRLLAEDGHDALLPARLDAPHMQMLERLEQTGGSDFDRLFVQAQIAAHKEAIRIHQAYYTTGDDHDLVGFAGQALKVVRRHHDMLKKGVSPLDTAIRQAL